MDLKNLVDNAQKLPNIPKVVQELIESFGNENIKNEEIAKKVSADQVLTAKVLRAANSAHYGGNRKVGSVSDAVFVLGFNAVRTLVLASGMTGRLKRQKVLICQPFGAIVLRWRAPVNGWQSFPKTMQKPLLPAA